LLWILEILQIILRRYLLCICLLRNPDTTESGQSTVVGMGRVLRVDGDGDGDGGLTVNPSLKRTDVWICGSRSITECSDPRGRES
jgi:hypothetical protein